MQERIITLATPVFFILIGIELCAARRMKRRVYHAGDAVASIGLGTLAQITGVFTRLLRIGFYAIALRHLALFHLSSTSPWVWCAAVLVYDFCYYWLHRAGHEVNLLWAAHVVHHQSEYYNLATALRQTSSGALLGWIFYLPMALLGFPLEVFAAVALIDLLYQFWIHTELIGRLGWFDRVFASPSNHRVHHAVNQRYLDRNYGGVLMLWDRLFGTFEEEDDAEPCVYGTRAPLRSFNPLWANFEVYARACQATLQAATWRERVMVWLGPPGWQSDAMAARFPRAAFDLARERYVPRVCPRAALYGLIQFALLLVLALDFLAVAPGAEGLAVLCYAAYLSATLLSLAAWFEARSYALRLELARLFFSAMAVLLMGRWFTRASLSGPLECGVALLTIASLAALWLTRSAKPQQVQARFASGTQP